MSNGFAKLCENPRVMQLMAQIEANINAREEQYSPRTYLCELCQDRGVIVTHEQSIMGDTVAVGRPCRGCTIGAGIEWQRSKDRFQGQRKTAASNRKLTDVERNQALNGDYSFLGGDSA